jgi:L-histidine N-alpha-methyltransferase
VVIDASQFPDAVRHDLHESLRARKVNHKFHYDSYKQTQKWLALHQAYSPARTDPHCGEVYEKSFAAVAQGLGPGQVHLVGLGCGSGQKDVTLLGQLRGSGRAATYIACDVSVAMVLVARQSALEIVSEADCSPVVCDLATAQDLNALLLHGAAPAAPGPRLFTFFGMLPNFEPEIILPKIAQLLGPGDQMLISANLAPGPDYGAGVERVLPLYDNALTRDWLMTFLSDLGVERTDGKMGFSIEDLSKSFHLKRIVAHFQFERDRAIQLDSEDFKFTTNDSIRLFFSYRHTPSLVRNLLAQYGMTVEDQWITPSEEEGVFLVRKSQ